MCIKMSVRVNYCTKIFREVKEKSLKYKGKLTGQIIAVFYIQISFGFLEYFIMFLRDI